MKKDLHLAELVQAVKIELGRAKERASEDDLKLPLTHVEMEVTVESNCNNSGGIDFKVINIGTDTSEGATHSVKLIFDTQNLELGR